MSSFLNRIAESMLLSGTPLHSFTVVLPTRRAIGAFKQIIASKKDGNCWLPEFTTLDEWACEISGMRKVDPLALRFYCYEAYREVIGIGGSEISKVFSWVDVLLGDYNDLEAQMLNPAILFRELREYVDIEHFSFLNEPLSENQESYRRFWNSLPEIHRILRSRLLKECIGYPGLIMQQASMEWKAYIERRQEQQFIVAGFNALSQAEQSLMKQMETDGRGKVYFDADHWYLDAAHNHAGSFIRKLSKGGLGKILFTDAPMNERKLELNVGNAINRIDLCDLTASLLQESSMEELQNTAVVLLDEDLLEPLLNRLPAGLDKVNITMGLSAAKSGFANWIDCLFALHKSMTNENGVAYFANEGFLRLMNHPFMHELNCSGADVNKYELFISTELARASCKVEWVLPLLGDWTDASKSIDDLAKALELLDIAVAKMDSRQLPMMLAIAGISALRQTVNRLQHYPESANLSLANLSSLLHRALASAKLNIPGEPYDGLQIMGLLETRTLGFSRVIVLPANEGTLPAMPGVESFIPFEIRAYHNLPGKKEKESVYAYLFYRLISHCLSAYCLFLQDTDDMKAGEKSRYLLQIEYELAEVNPQFSSTIFQLENKVRVDSAPLDIPKSPEVIDNIKRYLESRLSASSLNLYLNSPLEWYYKSVLKLKEPEENDALDDALYGTIVHSTLEELYKPYKSEIINEGIIKQMLTVSERLLHEKFSEHDESTHHSAGLNRLHFERAKKMIEGYLKSEIKALTNGDIKIFHEAELMMEHHFTVQTPSGPTPIKIIGFADHIEERNGSIQIVDFKTGSVKQNQITIKELDIESFKKHDKGIQLLVYEWLGRKKYAGKDIITQIISLVKPNDRTLTSSVISDAQIEKEFEQAMAEIIGEMLNPEIPITKNKDYKYSKFES